MECYGMVCHCFARDVIFTRLMVTRPGSGCDHSYPAGIRGCALLHAIENTE